MSKITTKFIDVVEGRTIARAAHNDVTQLLARAGEHLSDETAQALHAAGRALNLAEREFQRIIQESTK